MKKIIFLLLITVASYGQILQNPTFGNVKIKQNTTDNTATKVNVQATDGTVNTISKSDLVDAIIVDNATQLTTAIGNVNKLYATRDNNILYRFNGTIYVPMSEKLTVNTFGAIGNGINDDTAAIQQMINTLGYFTLKKGTYKITNSLIIPNNLLPFDKKNSGQAIGDSYIVCEGMAGKPAIKLATNTQLCRLIISDLSIIGDAENCINFSTSGNVYNSEFNKLYLQSTGDCLVLKNDFSCTFSYVQTSSLNGHGFSVDAIALSYFYGCYAHNSGIGKAGYRIKGFASLISCNGIDIGDMWGWFGANIADDGFESTGNISLIGCNIEDYNVRGLYCSYKTLLNIKGTGFVAKETGTYLDEINFLNSDNSLVIENSNFTTKGSTKTATSRITSQALLGYAKSNSDAFQDYHNIGVNVTYKIPYETNIGVEFGVDAYKIPFFTTDRNYGFNLQKLKTWSANSAVFSVKGESKVKTNNNMPTFFDSATDALVGQELYILIQDNFTTINHLNAGAGRFKMISGTNKTCTNGEIYHFIYDGVQFVQQDSNDLPLKANLAGTQTFTGIHNFPTATAGTNTTQVATTAFVGSAITTANSNNVTITGNQTITGFKTFAQLGLTDAPAASSNASIGKDGFGNFAFSSSATSGNFASLDAKNLTATRKYVLQDKAGTIALKSDLLYANQTITANKTVTIAEFVNNNELILRVDATAGNITVTLPTFTALQGYKVTVRKVDSSANSVLIQSVGGVNIDGASTLTVSGQYGKATVGADLVQYIIL